MKKLKFSNAIECPMCGGKTKVSYTVDNAKRTRTCKECGHKYKTVEILAEETEIVMSSEAETEE